MTIWQSDNARERDISDYLARVRSALAARHLLDPAELRDLVAASEARDRRRGKNLVPLPTLHELNGGMTCGGC